jgi:hypothetical protein
MLDEIVCPEGEVVQSIKSATILKLADGRHCRFSRNLNGDIFLATYYNSDYSDVEIQMRRGAIHPQFTSEGWEYSLTGFSFQDRLAVLGGGVLHASSLAWRGHGIAFSANSGTGKSTHVGLWQQLLGDEVVVVNDDKPAIVFEGDQAMLCGTPWSGKHAINTNVTVPLEAIVFIERGEQNLWKGSEGESICYTFEGDEDVREIRLVFDNDMNRKYHNMPCNYPLVETRFKLPATLIREYRIEGVAEDGTTSTLHITDNHLRFVRHRVDWRVKTLRFVPLATHGSEGFRLFDFEVK